MSSSWLRFVTLLLLVPSLGGTSAVLPVLLYDDVGVQDSAPNLIAALPGPLYPEQLEALAGGGPCAIAVANLNADGRQDLIAIRPASGDLLVLLSTAEGTYQPPQYFSTSERGPATVTLVDLNADGRPDLDTIPEPSVALPVFSSVALQTSSPAPWEPLSATELLQGYFPAK